MIAILMTRKKERISDRALRDFFDVYRLLEMNLVASLVETPTKVHHPEAS
jgi:hypothetical protein